MAEQLQLLCVVVTCQCLFCWLHVQDVDEELSSRSVLLSIKRRSIDREIGHGFCWRQVLSEYTLPYVLRFHEDVFQVVLLCWLARDLKLIGLLSRPILMWIVPATGNDSDSQVLWLVQRTHHQMLFYQVKLLLSLRTQCLCLSHNHSIILRHHWDLLWRSREWRVGWKERKFTWVRTLYFLWLWLNLLSNRMMMMWHLMMAIIGIDKTTSHRNNL